METPWVSLGPGFHGESMWIPTCLWFISVETTSSCTCGWPQPTIASLRSCAPPFHLLPVARGRSCTNLNWRWSSDWWGTNWSSRTGPLEPNPLFCRCRKKSLFGSNRVLNPVLKGIFIFFFGGGSPVKSPLTGLNLRLMWDEIFSLRQMLSDFKDQLLFWFGLEV